MPKVNCGDVVDLTMIQMVVPRKTARRIKVMTVLKVISPLLYNLILHQPHDNQDHDDAKQDA